MIRLLYKPFSMLGGVLARAVFKRVWKLTAGEDEVPKATDAQRGWREVLLAATLQDAIFALVKAAVDRGAAEGDRRFTGTWPGDGDEQPCSWRAIRSAPAISSLSCARRLVPAPARRCGRSASS